MRIYALTIFTGAFLLFLVQPLIGKYILPWFGGTPAGPFAKRPTRRNKSLRRADRAWAENPINHFPRAAGRTTANPAQDNVRGRHHNGSLRR